MVNSQNGWEAKPDTSTFVRTKVEGVGFWSANEDVATVLDDFTQWYHENIEPIDLPVRESPGMDDWSYNNRLVRGSTSVVSNHGSATARDLNATKHPRGVHNTYSPKQREKLRTKIDSYDGVLRHGEFYTSTIDGMHVEINTSNKSRVKAMADKIRARNKAAAAQQVEDDDMKLTDTVKLDANGAKLMGKKKGEEVTVNHLLQWGGPRQYQFLAAFQAQAAQIKALTAAMTAVVEGSEADVRAAFAQGVTDIEAQVAQVRADIAAHDAGDDGV